MILTIIYMIFVLYLSILVVWNVYETKSVSEKALGALVLILLLLRLVLVK